MKKTYGYLGPFLQNWINARLMKYEYTPKEAINNKQNS